MTRIPNHCCPIALDWFEAEGINPEIWVLGLPIRLDQLRNADRSLDWPLFSELCTRLGRIVGRDIDLYTMGRTLSRRAFETPSIRHRVEADTLDGLFQVELAGLAAETFPGLEVSVTSSEPGMVSVHAVLHEDDSDCRAFFELARGALTELPTLIGDAPVSVEIDHAPRWARYHITLFEAVQAGSAAAPTRTRAAPVRSAAAPVQTGAVRVGTAAAQATLDEPFEQCTALLSFTGLHELASKIVDELCREHSAVALWIDGNLLPAPTRERLRFESNVGQGLDDVLSTRSSHSPASAQQLLAMRGQPIKPPSHSLALALPNRAIGRLDLWISEPPVADPVEALDAFLPWIALALENACLREQLREQTPAPSLQRHTERTPDQGSEGGAWTTLERTADVICEVGADGRLLYVNPAVEPLLGHPPDHYRGRSFLEFVLPEEQEVLLEEFQKLLAAGQHARIVFNACHRSGAIRTIEALCNANQGSTGELRITCALRDVTEQRRLEASLRESADRYRSLLENDSMLIGVATPDGAVVVASPHVERALGIAPSDQLGTDILRCIHPDDRNRVTRAWLLSRKTGEPNRTDIRFIKPDGSLVWFEIGWRGFESADGQSRISVVMHEITARKKSENALRAISQGLNERGTGLYLRLVEHLCDALEVDGATLSRADPNAPDQASTLGIWFDGEPRQNIRFALEGTPGAQVFKGESCSYPSGVDEIFPATRETFGTAISAYAGAPLMDSAGRVMGSLAVVHRKPLAEPDLVRSMLDLFAQRAASELSRDDAQDARAESEKRFEALSQSSSDIIVELSKPHGIRYVSPGVLDVLGYAPDEALDADLMERIHTADREPFAAALSRVFDQQEPGHLPFRIRHRDGDWRWLDATYRAYHSESGEPRALALCRDVTQRTLAEQDREQLVSITQNSSDIIFLTSLTGGLRFINAAGYEALGLASDEDPQDKTLFDFLTPSDVKRMRFQIMPTVHRNQRWTGEVELRNAKTGEQLPTQATVFLIDYPSADQATAIAAICRDLRHSQYAEKQLRESEERYRMLAENPYDLISELDSDGRFVYVSPNFEAILQYSPEDLLGRDAFALVPEDERDEIQRIFQRAIGAESTFHADFRIRHRDGSYRWIDSTARAYRTAQGQMMAVLISRDVTERRRADEALRQSEERLRQSQKMEAIGRLAGGIAHDFNNLLTAIIGYCDLLLEEIGDEHPGRGDAQEILKAADRAGGLTRQLLAFSRRQVLQPKIIDLNALVADLERMLRRLIGEDIDLRCVFTGENARVKADPGQLEQVVLNLLVNARDAMPRGGRITITTALVEVRDDTLEGDDAIPPGKWVALHVSDTGSGMDEATMSRIFDPFFTTKPPGEGTGLGLSTAIGIVSQSGGHIRVASSRDAGTTFSVSLPRISEPPTPAENFAHVARLRGDETVLLVEDASPVRKLVARYLDRHGYKVLEASSGIAALRHARRYAGPVHLLLTDVILPRLDGREIAERVQALRPGVPVIYMSGFTDDSLSRHGVLGDDVVLLEKPFTPAQLLEVVRRILDAAATGD